MTFDKMSVWPRGYFRAFSSWLLKNRRDVSKKIAVIDAELRRIGEVTVKYRTYESGGSVLASEDRVGVSVTKGSSLGRLVQAYVAQGGNPLDISPFAYPSGTEVVSVDQEGLETIKEQYPHGGIVAPISVGNDAPLPIPFDPENPDDENGDTGWGGSPGGYLRTDAYFPARQGGRMHRGGTDFNIIIKTMNQVRGWANQDIKERLQNIEWNIIKLCDLREQLQKEKDEVLAQALGSGDFEDFGDLNPKRFNPGLQIQVLVQEMNEILFNTAEDGSIPSYGEPNETLNYLGFTFTDVPSESTRDAMGC